MRPVATVLLAVTFSATLHAQKPRERDLELRLRGGRPGQRPDEPRERDEPVTASGPRFMTGTSR